MSTITIHIQMMSGELLEYKCRARNGRAKYQTIKYDMHDFVHSEMKLDQFQHRVEFFHEDDEEKKEALCRERAEKFNRQYRRRGVATEEVTYATSDHCERLAIQGILDKNRTYEEGALVYARVEPFNLLERWERLDARENEPIEDE